MRSIEQRLNDVAQRLDELADEGPSELTTLAEELGRIADEIPSVMPMNRKADTPEWLARIEQIVEQAAVEIVGMRYGTPSFNSGNPYITLNLPNPAARYYMPNMAAADPSAIFKISGV